MLITLHKENRTFILYIFRGNKLGVFGGDTVVELPEDSDADLL